LKFKKTNASRTPIGKSGIYALPNLLGSVFSVAAAVNASVQKKIKTPRNADVGWERIRKSK
jgi:hypothetical protein